MVGKPNVQCDICGKWVYRNPNRPREYVACSAECRAEYNRRKNQVLVKCEYCGKEFYRKKSRCKGHIYCNQDCYNKAHPTVDTYEVIRLHTLGYYDKDIATILGCTRNNITRILNRLGYNGRKSKIDDVGLRQRISRTNRGKRTGPNNHKYKGYSDYSTLARGLFNSISRMYMLKHDYTCEMCGKRGGDLNTHHKDKYFHEILEEFLEKYGSIITLDNFSEKILEYPDFINEDNLMLLCVSCHRKIHESDENRGTEDVHKGHNL